MKNLYFIAAALLVLASCNKDFREEVAPDENGKIILTVSTSGTKTTLGGLVNNERQIYWADGDKINVGGVVSAALTGITANSITSTEFSFSETPASLNAVYPASIYKDASTITLPHKASNGVVPLAGTGSGDVISLGTLTSMLRISVKRASGASPDTDNLAYIEVSTSSTRLSGDFSINHSTCTLTPAASPAGDDLKVWLTGNWVTSSTAVDFFIPMPAGSYGFTVKVMDKKGDYMTKSTSGAKTFTKGEILALTEFEFVPTTTGSGLEIDSAEKLIAFANAYNNNEYSELGSNLVATVTSNITFDLTSSEAFNATGGIGTSDNGQGGTNYFNGTFNGGGHTISGLTATVPIFAYTGGLGTVKNLTIDNTCSFSFSHSNTAEGMFGSIVGYHKGKLDSVKVAAGVSLASVADVTRYTTLGGLVGRATSGTVTNGSEYSGLISTPAGFTSTNKLIIGGLVGRFTNNGSVSDSYFKGAISNEAHVTSTDETNPYLLIGGVVGCIDGGANVSSTNTTADHSDVASAYSGFNGKIVNKSTVAYHSAVGGIVGELNDGTVESCTNAATIANSVFKVGDDGSSYMKTGGIAGKVNADGTISKCTNNGTVQHRSNPRNQDLGGIAGYNAGTISTCTNNAAVNQMKSNQDIQAGRVVNLGGVIGVNASGASVSDVHNTANIEISLMEESTESEVRMGGVIAYNQAAIDGGNTKNITNTGRVYFSPYFATQFVGYEMGGIVGLSTASVQNVKNSGYVYFRWNSTENVASLVYMGGIVGKMTGNGTISGCKNEGGESNAGEVYLNVASGDAKHTNNYIGGILGYTTNNVTISSCENSGYIHGGNGTKQNSKPCFVGGIVAYLSGASSIQDCSNNGRVYNQQSNNDDSTAGLSTYTGGIAGWVEGTSGTPITIGGTSGCTVDASVEGVRGWVGGVVGEAKYVNISSCIVKQSISCACRQAGGVVGYAENCNISASSFMGSSIHGNNISSQKIGGIAAQMMDTTVDGCTSYVTTLTKNDSNNVPTNVAGGAIVGSSVSGNTIRNCHYQSTINGAAANIAGTGSFTDGGGNDHTFP